MICNLCNKRIEGDFVTNDSKNFIIPIYAHPDCYARKRAPKFLTEMFANDLAAMDEILSTVDSMDIPDLKSIMSVRTRLKELVEVVKQEIK